MNTNTLPQVPSQIASDTVMGATDKQIAFIEKLMTQIGQKTEGITSEEAQGARGANEMIRKHLASNGISKRQASNLIETLIRTSNINFGTPATPIQTPTRAPRVEAPIGIYREGEKIFCVRKARQSERVYAYELINIEGRNPRWEYVAGKVYELKVEDMISLEVAQQYGRRTGICCICGRFLTDNESVAKGIGPVCEQKYSVVYSQARGI